MNERALGARTGDAGSTCVEIRMETELFISPFIDARVNHQLHFSTLGEVGEKCGTNFFLYLLGYQKRCGTENVRPCLSESNHILFDD